MAKYPPQIDLSSILKLIDDISRFLPEYYFNS